MQNPAPDNRFELDVFEDKRGFAHWGQRELADFDTLLDILVRKKRSDTFKYELPLLKMAKKTALHKKSLALHADLISPEEMLTHYGLTPPKDSDACDACIETLKFAIEAILRKIERESTDINQLLDTTDIKLIAETAYAFRVNSSTPLLELFAPTLLFWQLDDVGAYPMYALATLLESPLAQELGGQLLDKLDWYGGDDNQETSAVIKAKLIWKAVALDLDPDSNFRNYDIDQPDNWGESYSTICLKIESHFRRAGLNLSDTISQLTIWLLEANDSAGLKIEGVPPQLRYRRSSAWVHLQHGINLTEALEPGSSRRLSYQQLLSYSLKIMDTATKAQKTLVSSTLAPVLLNWAEANERVRKKPENGYSTNDIEQAFLAFAEDEKKLEQAINALKTPMPDRLDMARAVLSEREIDPTTVFIDRTGYTDEYIDEHRILFSEKSWKKRLVGKTVLDLLASGRLHGPTPQWMPMFVATNDGYYESLISYKGLPNIAAKFETDFETWWNSTASGFDTIVKALLKDLPEEEREAIEQGQVQLYTVRKTNLDLTEHPKDVSSDNATIRIPSNDSPLVARYGFIIYSQHQRGHYFHEVFPYAGLIRSRDDFGLIKHQIDYRLAGQVPIDWAAYADGTTPDFNAKSRVMIHHLRTYPRVESPNSIGLSSETRYRLIAKDMARQYALRKKNSLYEAAKGVTAFDEPSTAVKVLKLIIPIWGPLEELIEIAKMPPHKRDVLKTLMAAAGLLFDIVSVVFPITKVAGLTTRFVKTSTAFGLRAGLPQLRSLAKGALAAGYNVFNPLAGTYDLARLLGRQSFRLTNAAASKIRTGINQSRRLLRLNTNQRGLLALSAPPVAGWKKSTPDLHLFNVDRSSNVLVHEDALQKFGRPPRYLIDPQTHRPYGSALMQTTDRGKKLTRHASRDMELEFQDGYWVLVDETPKLTKQWVRWGDDLFLESGGITYKLTPQNGGAVLKRLDHSKPFVKDDRLTIAPCRVRRGLDLNLCDNAFQNMNHSGLTARTNQGRNVQPWFTDLKITASPGAEQIVHNGHIHSTAGGVLKKQRALRPWDYKPTISIELTGGNETFKRITIKNGIVNGVNDSREISAVVAKRKTDNSLTIVTRADDSTYYSGAYAAESKNITLTKMESPELHGDPVTENDFLVQIYNGSHDAHNYTKRLHPDTIKADLINIKAELAAGRTPYINQFIGGPFDMETTAEEAALFCKYTRSKITVSLLEKQTVWKAIDAATPVNTRMEIAKELNRLHLLQKSTDKFTPENILERGSASFGLADRKKTVAYMKIRYKTPTENPDTVYYAVSGLRKPETDLPITRYAEGKIQAPESGWSIGNGVAVAPDNARYIDAQPIRSAIKGDPNEVIFLPDLKSHSTLEKPGNHRMLDSEHSIMNRLKTDSIDFDKVESVQVFSSNPTCPSCTMGLYGLTSKLPSGKFDIFEGN